MLQGPAAIVLIESRTRSAAPLAWQFPSHVNLDCFLELSEASYVTVI